MRNSILKTLVTGGAGFIGSEFVRQNAHRGTRIIVVDTLTYAGDIERLKEVKSKITFYKTNICEKNNILNSFHILGLSAPIKLNEYLHTIT